MYSINRTEPFIKWLQKLKDREAKARITKRIQRVAQGNLGDHKLLSDNLYELRLTYGCGYRIYYTMQRYEIILLLCGGDKSSQSKDIKSAKEMLKELNHDT